MDRLQRGFTSVTEFQLHRLRLLLPQYSASGMTVTSFAASLVTRLRSRRGETLPRSTIYGTPAPSRDKWCSSLRLAEDCVLLTGRLCHSPRYRTAFPVSTGTCLRSHQCREEVSAPRYTRRWFTIRRRVQAK